MAAAAILMVMYKGEVIHLQIVLVQTTKTTVAMYLPCNNLNICMI